jgi:hypothetical protein
VDVITATTAVTIGITTTTIITVTGLGLPVSVAVLGTTVIGEIWFLFLIELVPKPETAV